MPFEDELSEELRRTGAAFDLTGRTAVVDGALEHGRRALRRRRVAAVAGSVLALALVGGGGAVAAGMLGGPDDVANVASSGPATPTAAAPATDAASPTPTPEPTDAPTATPSDTPTPTGEPTTTPTDGPRTGEGSPQPPSPGSEDDGEPAPELDYTLLMPTFLKLLPEGLSVGEKTNGGGEFASVVVDDGKGSTLVQINVQPDMRDVADDLYRDATTLPDGTLLATSKMPGEKGGQGVVWWNADTMRPDGMRVVVSAFNSGAQSTPATRPEPALTMDQLVALATSPEWLKLQQR
ncbi:hypothetical protein RI138_13565 [Streptomyces sp. C11-1]|uniref:Alanine and proline-rich secreted protein Apa n=1 Tax=Streptomyces durocortorensis TaxID=2811104 RepID=A0ABY9VVE4_9ACTN|nr:hypothetical protein [Streptomyces durocortorensis]WNF27768.1 hypothetical protein RI138_13565 [Streptomyces durocortorensis]